MNQATKIVENFLYLLSQSYVIATLDFIAYMAPQSYRLRVYNHVSGSMRLYLGTVVFSAKC